ncbi:non-homologous end-joining DNA ligase [Gudongella sp. DL1XJH-153]|uniref:non-homologous end-joining DNA ligase n=1 Tax=Gudongella sp. DL1XJH-153 TaxID=3409804 RepID=UPI003BB74A6A
MKINDRVIELTNTDKVIFSGDNIKKGDIIKYYKDISPVMIPHIEDRPMTLHRFPNGIEDKGFYQQEISDYFPDWINRTSVNKKKGGKVSHVVCNNPETLVYLANQACITPHIWLSKISKLEKPDKIVFDLDPSDNENTLIVKAAKELKEFFDGTDLIPHLMTTGSRGLHVVVPIVPEMSFDDVRTYAAKIAKIIEKENPDDFTTQHRKEKRNGRLFIDYLRNSYGQTSVAPYGIRSIAGAPVATPLDWDELKYEDFDPQKYNIRNIFRRLGQKKDPWKNFRSKASSLHGLDSLL